MNGHDPTPTFEHRFHRARRRLRGRRVLRTTAKLLPWLQLTWLAVFLGQRFGLIALPAVQGAAAGLVTILVCGAARSFLRSPKGHDAALLLDRFLGTRELVTAAHEASAKHGHPFHRLTRERAAVALARAADAGLPPLTAWRRWRPAALGLVALFLLALLPPLRQQASASVHQGDPVVEATAKTLAEELAPLTEQAGGIDRPEALEALERLRQLVDEMQRGDLPTVEDALVALNQTEQALASLRDEMAVDGLDRLVEDMAAEPLGAELARAMTGEDRDALRETLRRMSKALSGAEARDAVAQRQVERLADRFEEMAERLEQQGLGELAAKLRELAEALRSGELERARELLESEGVAKACSAAGGQGEGDKLSQELADLLRLGRYLLGQEAPQKLAAEGGSGQGRGSGPRAGRGSTNREADRSYTTGDPLLRDRQSTRSADRNGQFEALYDSRLADGETSNDIRVLGQVGEAGEMMSETGRGLGVDGGVSLPLRPFAGATAGAPEGAMDLESVPLGYRDLVRGYFRRNDKEGDR